MIVGFGDTVFILDGNRFKDLIAQDIFEILEGFEFIQGVGDQVILTVGMVLSPAERSRSGQAFYYRDIIGKSYIEGITLINRALVAVCLKKV